MLILEKDVDKIISLYREGHDPLPNFKILLPELERSLTCRGEQNYAKTKIV